MVIHEIMDNPATGNTTVLEEIQPLPAESTYLTYYGEETPAAGEVPVRVTEGSEPEIPTEETDEEPLSNPIEASCWWASTDDKAHFEDIIVDTGSTSSIVSHRWLLKNDPEAWTKRKHTQEKIVFGSDLHY